MSILAARMILTSSILRSLKPKNLFVTLLLSNEITHRELQKAAQSIVSGRFFIVGRKPLALSVVPKSFCKRIRCYRSGIEESEDFGGRSLR